PEEFAHVKASVARAAKQQSRTLRYSLMTGCVIGDTRADALDRAQQLYRRIPRKQSFDEWLVGYEKRALVGSVDEIADRLGAYARAGCDRVMLQHLLHTALEPVRLIAELGQQLV